MKQDQCICFISLSEHCNFLHDGKQSEGGWLCAPHLHQPWLMYARKRPLPLCVYSWEESSAIVCSSQFCSSCRSNRYSTEMAGGTARPSRIKSHLPGHSPPASQAGRRVGLALQPLASMSVRQSNARVDFIPKSGTMNLATGLSVCDRHCEYFRQFSRETLLRSERKDERKCGGVMQLYLSKMAGNEEKV